jgi:hypothetical protein
MTQSIKNNHDSLRFGTPIAKVAGWDGSDFNFAKIDSDGRLITIGYHWNPATLAYEVNTGGTSGAEVNVTNFPATQPVSGTVGVSEDNKAVVVYEDGAILYLCKAAIGTALNAASWQIRKINTASGIVIQFCDGDASYNNTATDLATVQGHSYS